MIIMSVQCESEALPIYSDTLLDFMFRKYLAGFVIAILVPLQPLLQFVMI